MRRAWLLGCALLASPLAAQVQRPAAREALILRITEQFMDNYRRQAGLTPEQYDKFRAVAMRSFQQRRERQQREQELWQSLQLQMRPGMAAQPDSVSRLLDAIVAVRAGATDQLRADLRDYAAFLTPVQRGQLFIQYERLQRNIEDLIQQRVRRGGMGGEPPPQ